MIIRRISHGVAGLSGGNKSANRPFTEIVSFMVLILGATAERTLTLREHTAISLRESRRPTGGQGTGARDSALLGLAGAGCPAAGGANGRAASVFPAAAPTAGCEMARVWGLEVRVWGPSPDREFPEKPQLEQLAQTALEFDGIAGGGQRDISADESRVQQIEQ